MTGSYKSLRVLVIEDDAGVRNLLHGILKKMPGCYVALASNGREGLIVFRRGGADLVITDIIMPEQEGIETIRELRKLDSRVPIIAMSGGGRTANSDFLDIARKFGATVTLPKPFNATDLENAIKEAMEASTV